MAQVYRNARVPRGFYSFRDLDGTVKVVALPDTRTARQVETFVSNGRVQNLERFVKGA